MRFMLSEKQVEDLISGDKKAVQSVIAELSRQYLMKILKRKVMELETKK